MINNSYNIKYYNNFIKKKTTFNIFQMENDKDKESDNDNDNDNDNGDENNIKEKKNGYIQNGFHIMEIKKKELLIGKNGRLHCSLLTKNGSVNMIMGEMPSLATVIPSGTTAIVIGKCVFVTEDIIFEKDEKDEDKITNIFFSELITLQIKKDGLNPSDFFHEKREEMIDLLEEKLSARVISRYFLSEDGLEAIFIDLENF